MSANSMSANSISNVIAKPRIIFKQIDNLWVIGGNLLDFFVFCILNNYVLYLLQVWKNKHTYRETYLMDHLPNQLLVDGMSS